jgi:hypothetical protein
MLLFSAAIPLQGGTGLLNEQSPTYWARLFAFHGYLPIDCVRGKVWEDDRVEWFYAQNTLVFANAHSIGTNSALALELEGTNQKQLALVHPQRFIYPPGHSTRARLGLLGDAVVRELRYRILREIPKKVRTPTGSWKAAR